MSEWVKDVLLKRKMKPEINYVSVEQQNKN